MYNTKACVRSRNILRSIPTERSEFSFLFSFLSFIFIILKEEEKNGKEKESGDI